MTRTSVDIGVGGEALIEGKIKNNNTIFEMKTFRTRMWANAQRNGRPM